MPYRLLHQRHLRRRQPIHRIHQPVEFGLTLERTRPPTLDRLRELVAGQQYRVVHFMGHGGRRDGEAALMFEAENGGLAQVTARDFTRRVRGRVFLVVLNACISATPGPTDFSNLAALLTAQGTPYALGMQFVVADDDARTLSRILYSELARGETIEEAVLQARLALVDDNRPSAFGVPVLYTSLSAPAPGFAKQEGAPNIKDPLPKQEVFAIPRAKGAFQGRVQELKTIGAQLTGDARAPILTIHGGGGQGKTALAREAVDRFGFAWPGGVWATSLETLPARGAFAVNLARFLGVETGEIADPEAVEQRALTRLRGRRTLIVLDNAEALTQAVEDR